MRRSLTLALFILGAAGITLGLWVGYGGGLWLILPAVGLLAVAAWVVGRRLTAPVLRLRDQAVRIAGGDFTRPLDLKSRDEIGEIAARFDEMRNELRHLIKTSSSIGANLEQMVEERTRELREAQEEKERVMEQLIQAEKMAAIGTMASGIGHEINNPLYAILGSAEAVRDGSDLSHCREHGREIIRSTKEIARIVQNLSGYIRPGARHDLEPVDVNAKLSDAVSMARRSVVGDHVEFRRNLSPVPELLAKAEEIQQVFFNIIRNGIQAMEGRGVMEIRTDHHDGGIRVRISDTGPGIPEEQKRKIFDPFFTTKGPDEGEGLGLYIVRQIVNKYEGTISVESGPDLGTAFIIRFPVGTRA